MFLLHSASREDGSLFSSSVQQSHWGIECREGSATTLSVQCKELVHCLNWTEGYFSFVTISSPFSLHIHTEMPLSLEKKATFLIPYGTFSKTICVTGEKRVLQAWLLTISTASQYTVFHITYLHAFLLLPWYHCNIPKGLWCQHNIYYYIIMAGASCRSFHQYFCLQFMSLLSFGVGDASGQINWDTVVG